MIQKLILDCFGFSKPRNDDIGERDMLNLHQIVMLNLFQHLFFIHLSREKDRFFATAFKASPWFSKGFITF